MVVCVIGIGLIGGSLAISMKEKALAKRIIGVEKNPEHETRALELGLVDQVLPLESAVAQADLVIITIPVNATEALLCKVLDLVKENTVVTDMGSTKATICKAVVNHPKRGQYVAAHPIAGTEFTGPDAAISGLFERKTTIICDKELSNPDALEKVIKLFDAFKMHIEFMKSDEHDRHISYVSHLSHISSFTLGQTVLEKEKDEHNIFNMAGSGFESTVRLAKSSPDMWAPIFEQNAKNLSEALDAYIRNLQHFKELIDNKKTKEIHQLMTKVNDIRRVLDGIVLKNKAKIKSKPN